MTDAETVELALRRVVASSSNSVTYWFRELANEIVKILAERKGNQQMTLFKKYRRTQIAEMRPYEVGEKLPDEVSISQADKKAGSPKHGDMIARNPANHEDQWLVAADYFAVNFEPF